MTLRRVGPDYAHWPAVLRLIKGAFAFMEGRIDPPSSMHRLTMADMAASALEGAVFVVEEAGAPVGCIFCKVADDALYLGKLAVAASHRARGLARALIEEAEKEARRRGLAALELQTRLELIENHAAFAHLGFVRTGECAHAGFDRPTSITMRKALSGPYVHRAGVDYPHWPEVLTLIQRAFAYMDTRIGPPSPAHRLTTEVLAEDAGTGAVFVAEADDIPVACVFCRPSRDTLDALYVGRLAVDARYRGRGLARTLISAAEAEARRLGFAALVLDTSTALTELHATFAGLGFAHSSDDVSGPEIMTMRKSL